MDDATHRETARLLVEELRRQGVEPVLVGSSAVVALGLFARASKDADALAPPTVTLDEGRAVMRRIGGRLGIEPTEGGEQTISLVMRTADGHVAWRMDLLVPGDGVIPAATAGLIHAHAKTTPLGPAARAEHILAMKAVAWGDSLGKGRAGRAADYESDVMQLRDLRPAVDLRLVEELLATFPDARRNPAVRIINHQFGTRFREAPDPNI